MAHGRFWCEADMAGPAAGSTRSLVTLNRHERANFAVIAQHRFFSTMW